MKHNKTKKIIAVLASLAVLVCVLCTTTFASWSATTQGSPGYTPGILNIEMNNHLDLALDTSYSTDGRTYTGQILIENLGDTFFNLANLENSNTHSSEMENLYALTQVGSTTNQVGYSYYQSGMYNYDPAKFTATFDGYAGSATTVYGFPKYSYTDHSARITSLSAEHYFASASSNGFGNQNIRIYFPTVYSYNQLYQEVKGADSVNAITKLRVHHYYNLSGYDIAPDGALEHKYGFFNYTYYVELPRYEDLPTAYEPTTRTSIPYITFPAHAPWSSIRSFCEREFDRYIFGSSIYVDSHDINFTTNEVRDPGQSNHIHPDLADTLLSITDNNARGGSRYTDYSTPYIRQLATEHRDSIHEVDFGTWIGNAVQGFFSIEILPSFTFLDIYTAGIGMMLLIAFLKMFAGG